MNSGRLRDKAFTILPQLLSILALWIGVLYVDAQSSDRNGLRSLTLSHGLSDLLVNTIYKDSEGFLWFGTESSLDRFDGVNIIRYPVPGDRLKSHRVLSIIEGADGKLYVGSNQGLFELAPQGKDLTPLFPDKINFNVNGLLLEGQNLYLATPNGLYILDLQKNSLKNELLVNDHLSKDNDILGIENGGPDTLWLIGAHKLWSFNPTTQSKEFYELPTSSQATAISKIGETIYIGTDGSGVISFNIKAKSFEELERGEELSHSIITSLSETQEGELLASTDGDGVMVYSPEKRKIVTHLTSSSASPMILRTNSLYSALKDPMGLLWLGYYQGGVDYTPLERNVVSIYVNENFPQLTAENVRSFHIEEDLKIIGTHNGIYVIDEKSGKSAKFEKPVIDSNLIFTIEKWEGKYYIGTYHGGLYELDPVTFTLKKFGPKEIGKEVVFKIEKGPEGDLWVGTSKGLYRISKENPKEVSHYTSTNSQLPAGNVYEIFFDSLGRGWICTETGMAIWNGSYIQKDGFPEGFIDKMKIRIVYEDRDHNLYFAPDRGEYWVSDLSLKDFHPISQNARGQFSQAVSVIEDNDGFLWVGTDKGLARFDKNDTSLHDIINHVSGILNPIYNLTPPYKDENGDLWFGSTTGLHKVDYEGFKQSYGTKNENPLIISNIQSGGTSLNNALKKTDGIYEIELGSEQKDLEIKVTDLQYEYRDYFMVEYQLEGVDDDMRWSQGSQDIIYRDLDRGTYYLKIRASGHPETEIQLKIVKRGRFPWWWIAGGVFLVFLVISSYYYFIYKKEIKKLKAGVSHPVSGMENSMENGEEEKVDTEEKDEKSTPYRTTRLSEEECKRLLKKLEIVMKQEKPFINPDLKIKDLAELIGTNAHSMSFLFNQYLHKSYYDYVNEWRVEEFKRIVNEIDITKYTLSGLAEKCGFSSRASFFRHFKNHTGQTPAEYLKTISD